MILALEKIFRSFFAFFDVIAYTLIGLVYQLFMLISEAGIFSQASIQAFASRIYVLLGLFMIFRVSISLVTYILNPDSFSKGDVGAPALLKGFVFALLGIVLVPYVFEAAYSLQRIVLKDNLIGNLIMGMSADNSDKSSYLKDAGKEMSFVTLSAFVRLDTQFSVISEECAANPVVVDTVPGDNVEGSGHISEECSGLTEILGEDASNILIDAYVNKSIKSLTDGDLLNVTVKTDKKKNEFVVNYLPVVSTAAGLFIAYILLLFCIDIAVRSVKLSFLQLIAPIPLIARVEPKKGKEVFGKWLKECTSTYADVFVRLAAIYFVLFIITSITTDGSSGIYNVVSGKNYTGPAGLFVKVFIIIGALNFARELPKLISGILGVDLKGSGGFTLNPMKKIGTPGFGLAAGGALGAIGGAAGNFKASRDIGRNMFKSGLSGVGGAFTGAFRGGNAGMKAASKDGKLGFGAGYSASGVGGQKLIKNEGTTIGGRTAAKLQSSLGFETLAQRQDANLKSLEKFKGSVDKIDKAAEGQALKSDQVKRAQAKIDALKSSGPGKVSLNRLGGETDAQYQARYTAARAAAQAAYENDLKDAQNSYTNELKSIKKDIATAAMNGNDWTDSSGEELTGKIKDTVASEVANMKAVMKDESYVRQTIGFNDTTPIETQIDGVVASYNSIDTANKSVTSAATTLPSSEEYRTAHKTDNAAGIKSK